MDCICFNEHDKTFRSFPFDPIGSYHTIFIITIHIIRIWLVPGTWYLVGQLSIGWFTPTAPIFVRIRSPCRFLEIDPEIWRTGSMNPCQNPLPIFAFSPDMLVFSRRGYLGLGRSKISGGNKKKIINGLAGAHRLRAKLRKNKAVPRNYFVSVCDQLWALNLTWYWPYAVRSSNISAKRFTDMPSGSIIPGTGSFEKKHWNWNVFFSLRKRLTVIDLFESPGLRSGHMFVASASHRTSTKKLATSPSSAVHGGQYGTKDQVFMWH